MRRHNYEPRSQTEIQAALTYFIHYNYIHIFQYTAAYSCQLAHFILHVLAFARWHHRPAEHLVTDDCIFVCKHFFNNEWLQFNVDVKHQCLTGNVQTFISVLKYFINNAFT